VLLTALNNAHIEIGCDESGRGCLAGPVVAAAVILPRKFSSILLNDSKQVSKKNREFLNTLIQKEALAYSIGVVSPQEIDEINILNASILAMHKALDQIKISYDSILVDGNRFRKYKDKKHHCIVKGDCKYLNIAAASILAKTFRDKLMKDLDLQFPKYDWKKNKGYPTKFHRDAIQKFGGNKHHRQSFRLLPRQLNLTIK
jgi:ribonuclease HII